MANALKRESMTGKTIVASVGQNDTELLSKFDRLIVLSPKTQVYNDRVQKVDEHLEKTGIKFNKQSPVDVLLKVADAIPRPIANSYL